MSESRNSHPFLGRCPSQKGRRHQTHITQAQAGNILEELSRPQSARMSQPNEQSEMRILSGQSLKFRDLWALNFSAVTAFLKNVYYFLVVVGKRLCRSNASVYDVFADFSESGHFLSEVFLAFVRRKWCLWGFRDSILLERWLCFMLDVCVEFGLWLWLFYWKFSNYCYLK